MRLVPQSTVAIALCAFLALAGCSSGQTPPSANAPSPTAVAGTASASPVSASPDSARNRALDLSPWEYGASFASPSGRLWCSIASNGVVCLVPGDMNESDVPVIPDCGETNNPKKATAVKLDKSVTRLCPNELSADPVRGHGGGATDWMASGVGVWGVVDGVELALLPGDVMDGVELAMLPYGAALEAGSFMCASESYGVTCVNRDTNHGLLLRMDGIVTF